LSLIADVQQELIRLVDRGLNAGRSATLDVERGCQQVPGEAIGGIRALHGGEHRLSTGEVGDSVTAEVDREQCSRLRLVVLPVTRREARRGGALQGLDDTGGQESSGP